MTVRAVLLLSLILAAAPAFGQGTIAGQVTSRSLRGIQVVDVGIPGVTVELFAAGSDNAPLRTAVTDADGRYEFGEVTAGPYDVRASAAGFVGIQREGVLVTSGETATVDLALSLDIPPRVQGGGGLLPPYPIPNDPPLRACLHEGRETPPERARRHDAEDAMDLIARALRMFQGPAPTWEALAASTIVAALRQQGDPLANRIQWGSSEPLPGWGIAWVTVDDEARYALVDMRDPCGFSISSESLSGRPDPTQRFRVVPLS